MNFLDTNILVYAISNDVRAAAAQALLDRPFVVSAQTLNEFANICRKKLGHSWSATAVRISDVVLLAHQVVSLDETVTLAGLALCESYNLSFYDSTMLAAALQAGCTIFLHGGPAERTCRRGLAAHLQPVPLIRCGLKP